MLYPYASIHLDASAQIFVKNSGFSEENAFSLERTADRCVTRFAIRSLAIFQCANQWGCEFSNVVKFTFCIFYIFARIEQAKKNQNPSNGYRETTVELPNQICCVIFRYVRGSIRLIGNR